MNCELFSRVRSDFSLFWHLIFFLLRNLHKPGPAWPPPSETLETNNLSWTFRNVSSFFSFFFVFFFFPFFNGTMSSLPGTVPRMMRPAPGQNYPRTGFPLEGRSGQPAILELWDEAENLRKLKHLSTIQGLEHRPTTACCSWIYFPRKELTLKTLIFPHIRKNLCSPNIHVRVKIIFT